ncbi:uncharacterized protein N7459_004022 [Penicillium hispanicum]|uniref:uncharacterized protein n=1 Tax=Penicillium hispanicum TaxID=1080232 RepID=UPI00254093C3|nr:uncharacterized protein N7459_004022 [Penicillium hispanicum]KAJ5584222.1 hypothetical protein N7459_004022 [Penicillium hispanicum]
MENLGRPVITDFGLSVFGDGGPHNHPIQPNSFRAPEVVIGAKWDYSVDVWNLGALIWELLCGKGPFDNDVSSSESSSESSSKDEKHLAAIISLLGPPPADLLARGNRSSQYFDDDGKFKFPSLLHQEQAGIENLFTGIKEDERKLFMGFILRIL